MCRQAAPGISLAPGPGGERQAYCPGPGPAGAGNSGALNRRGGSRSDVRSVGGWPASGPTAHALASHNPARAPDARYGGARLPRTGAAGSTRTNRHQKGVENDRAPERDRERGSLHPTQTTLGCCKQLPGGQRPRPSAGRVGNPRPSLHLHPSQELCFFPCIVDRYSIPGEQPGPKGRPSPPPAAAWAGYGEQLLFRRRQRLRLSDPNSSPPPLIATASSSQLGIYVPKTPTSQCN